MIAEQDAPVDLSLVVACYNEGPTLRENIEETFRVLDALRHSCEVILIDDASRDDSWEIIKSVVATRPRAALRAIRHTTNVGRGGTVTEGIRAARGRWAGFLDIDLEVHAVNLVRCLIALEQGDDIVTAQRVYKFKVASTDRYVMSKGYSRLVRLLLNLPFTDTETGFKFFRRDHILPVLDRCHDTGWFWDTEVMALAHYSGLRIREVSALFVRRFDKRSSVRPLVDTIDYFQKLLAFRRRLRRLRQTARQQSGPRPAHPV